MPAAPGIGAIAQREADSRRSRDRFAAALTPVLAHLSGATYWVAWVVVGAVALTLVAFFVVPPLKGEPMQAMGPRFLIGLAVNGAWGFGTALFLHVLGAVRSTG